MTLPRDDTAAAVPVTPGSVGVVVGSAVGVGVLLGLCVVGSGAFVAGWLVVQLALALAWVRVLGVPSALGVALIGFLAGGAADALALARDRPGLRGYAAVVAVAFLVALLHQLVRRGRHRVTESLAATMGLVVAEVTAAVYLGVRDVGVAVAVAALLGVVAAQVVGSGAPRLSSLVAAAAGLAAAAAVGLGYAAAVSSLTLAGGFGLAVVTAVVAIGVDRVLLGLPPGDRLGAVAALALRLALPVVLGAAPAYVVARAALT